MNKMFPSSIVHFHTIVIISVIEIKVTIACYVLESANAMEVNVWHVVLICTFVALPIASLAVWDNPPLLIIDGASCGSRPALDFGAVNI